MDLRTYFLETKPADRNKLAEAVGVHPGYLYHCSRGKRKPSPKLCLLLIHHEPRLTLAELRPDLWGTGIDAMASSDDVQSPAGTSSRKVKEARMVA